MTVISTDKLPFEDQRWRTKQSETSTRVFVSNIAVTTYTCRYGPVSLDLSVIALQPTVPRDIPQRGDSGLVPDP